MTTVATASLPLCGALASVYPHIVSFQIFQPNSKLALPPGNLRIGGDSPSGLVLSGGAPAQRTVRLFDMATGQIVAETTSLADGTYSFTGLSYRPSGYAVWIVGSTGEKGEIITGIYPGTP